MNDLLGVFYSQLILRDVFGKIVPGSIAMAGVLAAVMGQEDFGHLAASIPLGGWVLLLGAAWLVGFAVQGVGEQSRLFLYDPKEANLKVTQRYELRLHLRERTGGMDDLNKENIERLYVIREACGNGYVATMVAAAALLWGHGFHAGVGKLTFAGMFPEMLHQVPMVAGIFGATVFLRKMHLAHVGRAYVHSVRLIKKALSDEQFAQLKLRDDLDDATICAPSLVCFSVGSIVGYAMVALVSYGSGYLARL